MPQLPTLADNGRRRVRKSTAKDGAKDARRDAGLVFAVYAPFGSDPVLSQYPASTQAPIAKQALVRALQAVAAEGVNVSALIDLYEDDSWLVEIPAFDPKAMAITSAWKQDMSAPQALAGFLRRTHERFPCGDLVLALEGHGGGFIPDIDPLRITPKNSCSWGSATPPNQLRWVRSESSTRFEPEAGSPALPVTSPELPVTSPELPASRLPMSTWALGEALRSAGKAGVPKAAVIHFNNCFNASVELLHTVAPWAGVATGYANYDFFTAGAAYPAVFKRLRAAGTATAEQLAQWFALENGALLNAKKNHPTVGATVVLSRMSGLATALDTLSDAMTAALRSAQRADAKSRILKAAIAAQHYDTEPGYELQAPDQFVDLGSFAVQLQVQFAAGTPVAKAAVDLQAAAAGVWQYGAWDRPWMDETRIWDFRARHLGLNILLPDPALQGVWDWRSPYYLSGKVDPSKPPAQRHVIDFLADQGSRRPRWVEFIVEYHRDTPFVGFLPARPPLFPVFDLNFKPRLPHPGDGTPGPTGKG